MELKTLIKKAGFYEESGLMKTFETYDHLIRLLRKKNIPPFIVQWINSEIDRINSQEGSNFVINRKMKNSLRRIFELLEKKLKIVPRNYYRKLWTALGMATFGLPLGVVFGLSMGNMAFIGVGLPIGLATGIALGNHLDNVAAEKGNQLDIDNI